MSGQDWFYVTGCDSGFGAECVRILAKQKRYVFAGHFLEDSAAKLKEDGEGYIHPLRLDVTNQESVDAAAAEIAQVIGGGRLLGLVNNAGVLQQTGYAEMMPLQAHRTMMEVNYFGLVRVTNSVLPLIRKCEGRIVNTASIAGCVGISCAAGYCASKYAVEGYSDALRREMQSFGVTVHIVEPGIFAGTALYATAHNSLDKIFANAPQKLQQDYGVEYKNATGKDNQLFFGMFNNTDTSKVPKAYVHALTAKHPQYRYRVGWDSKYVVTVLQWMHESWQDLTSIPFTAVPASSDSWARWRAMNRYGGWPLLRRLLLALVGYLMYKHIKQRFTPAA
eukprot:TRINITY_DN1202_c0_g1_i4.p1 TRINITY_DN1202_c0_g1~~TRINITY_DN1202_c0_g1_i4.p1  ORF type:complete len:335 (+),score=157.48 TRINITY_DN1202_c0_g1_i4:135-1139(+)